MLLAVTYAKLRLGSKGANLAAIEELIDHTVAGCIKKDGRSPDMILLSEAVYTRGNRFTPETQMEETGGPFMEAMANKARQHNCWMAFNWYEQRTSDGKRYNNNKMLNRSGEVVYSHDKTFITPDDKKIGCSAGSKDDVRPADTEFGPIGMLICFDVDPKNSPKDDRHELIRLHAERGAKMVLVSTIGDYVTETLEGGKAMGVWTAVSGQDSYRKSGLFISNITDPTGRTVAGAVIDEPHERTFCSAEVTL